MNYDKFDKLVDETMEAILYLVLAVLFTLMFTVIVIL